MASVVLGTIGSAVGPSLFGAGFSVFGVAITGAQIGGALGALAGSMIDSALMPGQHIRRSGPRLSDIQIQSSTEGAPIPRLYGRVRVAGQLIWAAQFRESAATTTSGGGKGMGRSVKVSETNFTYTLSFAIALCEGPITKIGRVWADGKLLDLSLYTTRLHHGAEDQSVDPTILSVEGSTNSPAYRGLTYIVFEDMPLAAFGNRIPQLQFEVIRALCADNPDALENHLTAVTLIPGAGEFIYASETISADHGEGITTPENAHNANGTADMPASIEELRSVAPALKAVSLVAGWFGNDLRCGQCQIKPGVESTIKNTYPESWSAAGLARDAAHLISQTNQRSNYGGTPSDQSLIQAIQHLKDQNLRVLFNPFLFMDIPADNILPDPYSTATSQAAFPWRGRITCDPAPGQSESVDQTEGVNAQIEAFFHGEWGYRRMILHYAQLCHAAGGVYAFLIGSELGGLTWLRSSATTYPVVAELKTLAADVRAILGASTKISYAADWSEYYGHQTHDTPGALLYHLDPLWSDPNIDFIGIDNYLPLSDWRDGTAHLDAQSGTSAIHDPAYLSANIQGGEYYDWYYPNAETRNAQLRSPITDWIWRAKDFWNWWSHPHHNRPDGIALESPTLWQPQSKPIWFCELGCPALDKGSNQPNVFYDAKSSESAFSHYSNGQRDDLIQRRFLESHLKFWNNPSNNPSSPHYAGRMVDSDNLYLWTWDARPYPFFPVRADIWSDAENYRLGHWLNGRLGAVQLADLVRDICVQADFSEIDVSQLDGLVTGFAITDVMSPRDALAPLAIAFHFDAVESEGKIHFRRRGQPISATLTLPDLILPDQDQHPALQFIRAQETDLPHASRIGYIDADADYRQAVSESRRLVSQSDRVASSSLPLVLDQGQALGISARLLQDAWVMRETARCALPPSALALDAGDEIQINLPDTQHRLRIAAIDDAAQRKLELVATDPSIYEPITGPERRAIAQQNPAFTGRALLSFLDLPLLSGDEQPHAPHLAAFAGPWPGAVLLWRSAGLDDFTLDTVLNQPATMGVTIADFYTGPLWRWDQINQLTIRLFHGSLSARADHAVLNGANLLAVENHDGAWEVLQFAQAELIGPKQWRLSRLLRGQAGTEHAMRQPLAAGARIVLLDQALRQSAIAQAHYDQAFNYLWGPDGKPLSDPAYQGTQKQFQGTGLRPYAPSHLRAQQSGADILISWTRRDRAPLSDRWDATDIPLSESSELYTLNILQSDGSLLRSLTPATPHYLYPAAEIETDFPLGIPSPFRFSVAQCSALTGPGPAATSAIYL